MSINFNANQYENAFTTLKNWEVPKGSTRHPKRQAGFTQIIATNRGHLYADVQKSRASPWGSFVGTWDMPTKLPGNHMTNTTARSELAIDKLARMKTEGDVVLSGQLKRSKIPPCQRLRGSKQPPVNGDTSKIPSPKAESPKSAEPIDNSPIRSGAENPIPDSKFSPGSVDWPRPDGSRLEKPISPPAAPVRSPVPMAASPEPELQHLDATSPADPVSWPMPKSTSPLKN